MDRPSLRPTHRRFGFFIGAAAFAAVALVSCTPGSPAPEEPTTTTTSTTTTTLPPHDVTEPCISGQTCNTQATGTGSTLTVATEAGTAGQVTIDINEPGNLTCTGIIPQPFYVEVNPDIYTLNSTNNAAKTITITTPNGKAALDAVPGASVLSLGVCFASPNPFTSLQSSFPYFGPAQQDVSGDYVGLLPPCQLDFAPFNFAPPCVSARQIVGAATKVTAKLPAGDPRMK